ncbi:MAG TPA: hypothetical protein VNE58_15155 [Casimicrobiaceae bacterium]|nr:hypothetical protein [Casimicrobiaceae bacterium]
MSTRPLLAVLCVVLALIGPAAAQQPPDAPAARSIASPPQRINDTYADALARWRTPEDIARFLDATFVYDRTRALALAEPTNASTARPAIYAPADFYAKPQGVCVDLARFGVETLDRIDPKLSARYLMIEFAPVTIEGRTLRRHWIAMFRRDGALWFYADSSRPEKVDGPYATIDAFIADYRKVRGREIVGWREQESFARRTKAQAKRELRS